MLFIIPFGLHSISTMDAHKHDLSCFFRAKGQNVNVTRANSTEKPQIPRKPVFKVIENVSTHMYVNLALNLNSVFSAASIFASNMQMLV